MPVFQHGKILSSVLAGARFAVAPEPARLVAGRSLAYFVFDVVDQLDLSAIESVYEEEERGHSAPSADDDEDSAVRLLCWVFFLAPDQEEVGGGCGLSGISGTERTGFPDEFGFSQAASGGAASVVRSSAADSAAGDDEA